MKIRTLVACCSLLVASAALAGMALAAHNTEDPAGKDNVLLLEIQNGQATAETDARNTAQAQSVSVVILSAPPFISFENGQQPQLVTIPLGEFRTVSFPFTVNDLCTGSQQAKVEVSVQKGKGYSFTSSVEFPVVPVAAVDGIFSLSTYPNPSGGRIVFNCRNLKGANPGRINIYNMLGQTVSTFAVPRGTSSVAWQGLDHAGREVCSGVYFYHLNDGDQRKVASGKLIIMR